MKSAGPRPTDAMPFATVRYGCVTVPGLASLPVVATYFEFGAGRHTLLGNASGGLPNAIGCGALVVAGALPRVVGGGVVGGNDPSGSSVISDVSGEPEVSGSESPPRQTT